MTTSTPPREPEITQEKFDAHLAGLVRDFEFAEDRAEHAQEIADRVQDMADDASRSVRDLSLRIDAVIAVIRETYPHIVIPER